MPKTLLLADDSVVIQKLVALSFANEDVELVTVYNGDDAISKAREVRPDLVLADVWMPGKSGYEVCEAIKAEDGLRQVPVLLLTGTFEAFDEDRAREVGSDGQITKPFEAQALVQRVNELLARAPAAPAPIPAAPTPEAAVAPAAALEPESRDDSAFDFFEDDLSGGDDALELDSEPASLDPLMSVAEAGGSETSDPSFGGDDLLRDVDDRDAPSAPPPDRTVAILADEAPAASRPGPPGPSPSLGEAPTVTASGFAGAAGAPAGTQGTAPGPAAPPAVTDPAATVLSDDFGLDPSPSSPAADVFGDEFAFGGADRDDSEPDTADELVFGFDSEPDAPGADLEPLSDEEVGTGRGELLEADLDPAGSSAFDVSASELQVSVGSSPDLSAPTDPEPPIPVPAPEAPATSTPAAAPPIPAAATPRPSLPSSTEAETPGGPPAGPDLSDVLRDRVHETLEKVAWEAFADLSESVVRQVVERVERVAWEVIPQMAETLVREEIRKMKGEDPS